MSKIRNILVGAVAVLGATFGSVNANAAPFTALFLSIDESGSIGATDFASQMADYAAVLGSGIIPLDGTVALGVGLFDSGNQILSAMTLINNQAALDAVIATITGYGGYNGGGTDIAGAINAGAAALNAFSFGNLGCSSADVSCIIDVSTDGGNNAGNAVVTAAALSHELDIITNCLGIGGGADCSWVTANGFSVTANNFNELSAALRAKIIRETGGGGVPAPAALFLIGFGLFGLGAMRTRREA
jgi:uncharacterized protein DUF1194